MNFYEKFILPNKKFHINKEKANRIILNKNVVKVIEEQNNLPMEIPNPINLKDIIQYYDQVWKTNGIY